MSSIEKAELAEAKRRIAQLETELEIARRAVEELKESTDKGGSRRPE